MKRFQVSILGLVLIVVACATAFTALRTASYIWYSTLYSFTTVLLLAAVVAARFRRGNEKVFWFGFAVFGWGFFLLGLGPWPDPFEDINYSMGHSLNRNLLTFRVVLFLVPYLRTDTNDLDSINKITEYTIGIAHLLTTLALGIGGGLVAILIRRRRGPLVSVSSLAILLGMAMVTAFAASINFAGSTPSLPHSVFKGEPSLETLSRNARNATVYRLVWLPTSYHPVCVRISRAGEGANLRVKVLDGWGASEPGQIAIDRTITLGLDQVKVLDRQLVQSAFWTMPMQLEPGEALMGGDRFIVEGVKGGKYHIVNRVIPDPAYATLCRQILDLTGLKMREAWEGYDPKDDEPEM